MPRTSHKSLNYVLNLEVYPFDVMFSFGQTDQQLTRSLNKYKVEPADIVAHEDGIGRCWVLSNGAMLIRLRDYPTEPMHFGVLQHEILHAVTLLFHKIGMPLVIDASDEAYTYLMGFITHRVYEEIERNNKLKKWINNTE
jgi:hypothetical protein